MTDDTPAPTPAQWTVDSDGWLCENGLAVQQLGKGNQQRIADLLNRAGAAPDLGALRTAFYAYDGDGSAPHATGDRLADAVLAAVAALVREDTTTTTRRPA